MTSTPERGFEAAFCQMLISEGHRIVHIDAHSPTEQGKDVLSVDASGRLCGFQLKAGDITTARWRSEIFGELQELATHAVLHPNFRDQLAKPYLVITGRMNEPALLRLSQYNATLPKRQRIELVSGSDLLVRFINCQQGLLPETPEDFKAFLEMLVADGTAGVDKRRFAERLQQCFRTGNAKQRSGERARLLSAGMVTAAHMLAPPTAEDNHWALCEGWTMAAAQCAYAASKGRLPARHWRQSFELAREEAVRALHRVADEAIANPSLILANMQGDGGFIWRARASLVAGIVAASRLIRNERDNDGPYLAALRQWLSKSAPLGEYAFPSILAAYWFIGRHPGEAIAAENFLGGYVGMVARVSSGKGFGFPNPYYTIEDCLARLVERDQDVFGKESFWGQSYSLLPAVLCLVRAGRRRLLESLWHDVVGVNHCQLKFKRPEDMLRFRDTDGKNYDEFLPRPTSWKALQNSAAQLGTADARFLPNVLLGDRAFALLFFLVHPHRAIPRFTAWLDQQYSR